MRIIILFLCLSILPANALSVEVGNKYANYAQAHAAAVKSNKPIFLMFTASWCGPCQDLKRKIIYAHNIWPSLNKHFIVHMVDVDKEKETVQLFIGIFDGSVPTIFFLDNRGKRIIGRHIGGFNSILRSNDKAVFISWYKFVHSIR